MGGERKRQGLRNLLTRHPNLRANTYSFRPDPEQVLGVFAWVFGYGGEVAMPFVSRSGGMLT